MCGRYYIAEEDSAAELQEIIEQLNRRDIAVKTGEYFLQTQCQCWPTTAGRKFSHLP